MATGVQGRRSHEGNGGQARTRLARRAVVQAARVLFLDRGYAATTIEAISEESDVPPATVYRLFSSKLGILKALLDVCIAGDDEAIPVQSRPHARALFDDPDPRSQLSGFAGITGGIMARAEPVYRILVSAAGSDPGAAALLAEQARQRDRGQQQIARSLARAGALRPGLRERDAADIIHALMSPEVYRLLVGDRGWPPQRYEQWLNGILTSQLLPPPSTGGGRTDPPTTVGLTGTSRLTGPVMPGGVADSPCGATPWVWEPPLTVQGRLFVKRAATRWPAAMDPAARAMAAGTLRRFGTPAWLRARVAHSQNGRTMVGDVATPLA